MSQVVTSGPLRFRTKPQLDQLRIAFVDKTPSYGLTLIGSSVSGQSYQFAFSGNTYTEEEFGDILAAAYNQLGEFKYGTPSPNRVAARF